MTTPNPSNDAASRSRSVAPVVVRLKNRGDDGNVIEFNNTSMTDVIFILLIFFISLTELKSSALEIQPPEVSTTTSPQQKEDARPVSVDISKDGKLFLDGTEMPTSTSVVDALTALRARDGKEPRIRIRGDKEGHYGTFVEVIFALSQAELRDIEIVVQAKK